MTRRLALSCGIIALGLASAAAAATWTPKQAASLLTSGTFYRADANLVANIPSPRALTAKCIGVGIPTHGSFAGFRCAITWKEPNDQTQIAAGTEYVRIWSTTGGCLSTANLASCPPALPSKPLPRDPRVCSNVQKNLAACVSVAANTAMQAAASAKGAVTAQGTPVQLHQACQATTSWTVYTCKWSNGSGTVSFVSGPSGWTTNAVVSP